MHTLSSRLFNFKQVISPSLMLFVDALHFLRQCLRSPTALAAENLFLRKQLVLYQERHITPRRATHVNVTAHPTASWTMQQLREAIPCDHASRFLLHDRDSIFSAQLDRSIRHLGLRVVNTPPQTPQANALCERLIGTRRRECLDFLLPLTTHHLSRLLCVWMRHYNTGRPHMALGPGIPQLPSHLPVPLQAHRHRLPEHPRVRARPILGGLHHDYQLAAA